MSSPRARYEFGDFTLDVGQQQLLRRGAGEAIPLTGKVFDTLVYFVENAGVALDKDVMLRSIWPGVVVEENSLVQNVSTLRQLLGESRGENRYIATIPRRGYRFVALVTRCDEPAAPGEPATSPALPLPQARDSKRRPLALAGAGLALLVLLVGTTAWFLIPTERSSPAPIEDEATHTHDPEAYALYASGKFAWTRQTEPSLLQAIGFFEKAVAKDPGYALAYSALADSYAVLGVFGIRAPHEVFPKARLAVEKALSIDPNLASAHSALGHIKVQYEHDWEGAAREYARAIELDPSVALTHHRRGLLYAMQGDIVRAVAASQKAQQIEPLWLAARAATGQFVHYARRYDESIQLMETVLALDDRLDNARSYLIRNLLAKGDYERALREIDKRPIQAPGSNAHRAQALALSGRRDEAIVELNRVLKLSKERYVAAYDIALIHAALSDTENAFAWLERAVEDRSTLINFLAQDPMFDALHTDPRFAPLVQKIGIYRRALPHTADHKATRRTILFSNDLALSKRRDALPRRSHAQPAPSRAPRRARHHIYS